MYNIYDTNGDLIGFYDDNMLAYNADGSPMIGADGAQMEWTGTQFLTQSEINFAATGTASSTAAGGSAVTYQGNTPPATSNPNAILKTLTGQMYKYDATGANPVLYTAPSASGNLILYGGLALLAFVMLSPGSKQS